MFEMIEKNSKNGNAVIGNDMLKNATNKIKTYHEITKNAILGISLILAEIASKPKEYLESSGFSTIADYAEECFGYKKSYTYKLIKISKFVSLIGEKSDYKLSDLINDRITTNYRFDVITDSDGFEYSPSQMLELIPLSEEQIKHNQKALDSALSCKELRQVVKDIINPPIVTTATVTDTEEKQSEEENITKQEEIVLTDKDRILQMLEICSGMENIEIKERIINVFQKSLKLLEK